MKLRLATPLRVLDVGRLGALTGVGVEVGVLRIGALTRHAFFEQHEPPRGLDILAEAARVIGDRQVRNMGTMGGALAEVDPAGDWGAALVALDATVGCRSVRGERTLTIDDLMVDAYTSALAPDELLTDIRVPLSAAGGGSCYMKLERKAGDFAIASVGVAVRCTLPDTVADIGIGLSGVGLTPMKARGAESALRGAELTDAAVRDAAARLGEEIEPLSDLRGSTEYKRDVAMTLFTRALATAWERARRRAGEGNGRG